MCEIPIVIALVFGFCLFHLQTGGEKKFYILSVKKFVLFKKDKDDKPFREVLALHLHNVLVSVRRRCVVSHLFEWRMINSAVPLSLSLFLLASPLSYQRDVKQYPTIPTKWELQIASLRQAALVKAFPQSKWETAHTGPRPVRLHTLLNLFYLLSLEKDKGQSI